MFTIIGAMAELERNIIRERVLAGMEHARRDGTKSGQPVGRPNPSLTAMKWSDFAVPSVYRGEQVASGWRDRTAGVHRVGGFAGFSQWRCGFLRTASHGRRSEAFQTVKVGCAGQLW